MRSYDELNIKSPVQIILFTGELWPVKISTQSHVHISHFLMVLSAEPVTTKFSDMRIQVMYSSWPWSTPIHSQSSVLVLHRRAILSSLPEKEKLLLLAILTFSKLYRNTTVEGLKVLCCQLAAYHAQV